MTFELLPTIDIMIDLYQMPRTMERFQEYLKILQGDQKGELAMPISGFNPMAKEHILQKLTELKNIKAEQIMNDTLTELNKKCADHSSKIVFKVALNLSDDLKGGWTNRYTSDYDGKFKISALIKRQFCAPVFWTSEQYTEDLVKNRTLSYCYRTVYWRANGKPGTLKEHIEMERFADQGIIDKRINQQIDFRLLETFYNKNKDSKDYQIIFNFLYGDKASTTLGFPTYGIKEEMSGFEYARQFVK